MRIAVLTSGGDAPGMNAAVRMLVKVALARGHEAFGVRNGYHGLIEGTLGALGLKDVDGITRHGGTVLGSARSKAFREEAGRARARETLAQHHIDGLVVIGGNGSLHGAHVLGQQGDCRIVGLPASIDNDIGHTRNCIGVDTAVNTIVEACDRISDTATAHRRCFIVEVMGRDVGFLAMRAGLAAEADAILHTDPGVSHDRLIKDLGAMLHRSFSPERDKRRVLIIKAEGVKIPTPVLADRLRGYLGDDERVPIRETVLGHVVRGGSPSQSDRVMAQRLAFEACLALEDGAHDVMMGWDVHEGVGESTDDPRVRRVPLAAVLEETQRVLAGESDRTQGRVALLGRTEEVLAY